MAMQGSNNLVNTDPEKAWLKNSRSGWRARPCNEAEIVASPGDAFSQGDQLGANGMRSIRDSRGRLVQWAATIERIDSEEAEISLSIIRK